MRSIIRHCLKFIFESTAPCVIMIRTRCRDKLYSYSYYSDLKIGDCQDLVFSGDLIPSVHSVYRYCTVIKNGARSTPKIGRTFSWISVICIIIVRTTMSLPAWWIAAWILVSSKGQHSIKQSCEEAQGPPRHWSHLGSGVLVDSTSWSCLTSPKSVVFEWCTLIDTAVGLAQDLSAVSPWAIRSEDKP